MDNILPHWAPCVCVGWLVGIVSVHNSLCKCYSGYSFWEPMALLRYDDHFAVPVQSHKPTYLWVLQPSYTILQPLRSYLMAPGPWRLAPIPGRHMSSIRCFGAVLKVCIPVTRSFCLGVQSSCMGPLPETVYKKLEGLQRYGVCFWGEEDS